MLFQLIVSREDQEHTTSSKTDRQPLPSKPVKVETRGPKEASTVFVSNLSFNITEQVLRDVFSQVRVSLWHTVHVATSDNVHFVHVFYLLCEQLSYVCQLRCGGV